MHLFALIALTMCAFAANSVLSRAGIDAFGMDPIGFSGVRLAAGAGMLGVLVAVRGGWPDMNRARIITAGSLLVYLVPFSIAYLTLPSGVGALILFGVVQITMFAGSALAGARPSPRQWVGMSIAMMGLAWLLWPSDTLRLDGRGVLFMILSGISWGVFSLRGRGSRDPLGAMALSFGVLIPFAVALIVLGSGWSWEGVALAAVAGAVTSGLGYALWYRVLPQIAATTGAVAQLSVPVIAIIAGALFLAEAITLDVVVASVVVLGGIAVAVLKRA